MLSEREQHEWKQEAMLWNNEINFENRQEQNVKSLEIAKFSLATLEYRLS